MAYEVKLTIKGEETTFKRTEEPYLKDITRALILQQHQVKMYSKDGGPADKDFSTNESDVATFASDFFRKQFTPKDFIEGAHSDATISMAKIIDACLGVDDSDSKDDEKEAKK